MHRLTYHQSEKVYKSLFVAFYTKLNLVTVKAPWSEPLYHLWSMEHHYLSPRYQLD